MSTTTLTFDGPIAILTLNRPETYNALTWASMTELSETLSEAVRSTAVRAIVLTGEGRGFCSGADLAHPDLVSSPDAGEAMRRSLNLIIQKMRASPKPVVVAVNGAAAGGGAGIALAGDIVLASRTAKFVLSFVRIGAVLDAGASAFVQRAMGPAQARALALLGEPLSAEEAQSRGLIWKVTEPEALMEEALAVAKRLAEAPPLAISMIKRQLEESWAAPMAQVLDLEADLQSRAFASEDLREGAAAFVERRSPRFRGA